MISPLEHDQLGPRCIVALDFSETAAALRLARALDPQACRVKVGKELFVRGGPAVVRELHAMGHQVFLDLKFHDIPNTVAGACAAAADLGVWMMNVHASGGRRMMEAARAAVAGADVRLIAVTVLTSLAVEDLSEMGIDDAPEDLVVRWAQFAEASGMDGVVCSPSDLTALRGRVARQFLTVTPGIRPVGVGAGDQRRVTTPGQGIALGASYLVVGRAITGAADPLAALVAINEEIDTARAA